MAASAAASRVALCGYTGFVGGYLHSSFPDADLYNSKNLADIRGKTYDTVFVACVPAAKWLANKEPEADLLTIQTIQSHLECVQCSRMVLLSTIDVHNPSLKDQAEDSPHPLYSEEPYGRHRRLFEEFIIQTFPKHHIIRLPALFGLGIKKNYLYDLLNNRLLETIHLTSRFQWYDLRWLASDVRFAIEQDLPLLHAYPEPLTTGDIVQAFFPFHLEEIQKSPVQQRPPTIYCQGTIHRKRTAAECMTAIKEFVRVYRAIQSGWCNRLCVSNLHWKAPEDPLAFRVLKVMGVNKVEVVPGRYFSWNTWSPQDVKAIRQRFDENGMTVTSLQAVMFGITGSLSNPETFKASVARLEDACSVAQTLGAKLIVFGSPTLRADGCTEENLVDLLKAVVPKLEADNVMFCLEPNSKGYKCEIGVNMAQVQEIVKKVSHPLVRINYDTGNATMESDPCPADCSQIGHIQVSMPFLKDVDSEVLRKMYKQYSSAVLSPSTSSCAISLEVNSSVTTLFENLFALIREWSPRVLICGSGWYGCHASMILRELGVPHEVVDRSGRTMTGSSARNQNRLHLGFHYPRAANTRQECAQFYEFMGRYGESSQAITNVYIVSPRSLVSASAFRELFAKEKRQMKFLPVGELSSPFKLNPAEVDGDLIIVEERFLNPAKVEKIFPDLVPVAQREVVLPATTYDRVLDCTYGQLLFPPDCFYEVCISLVYRLKVAVPEPIGLTVMDGPFFSLFPYDPENNLYTLTHVVYTPMHRCVDSAEAVRVLQAFAKDEERVAKVRLNMEREISALVTNFLELMEYTRFFLSLKTKFNDAKGTDDRSLRIFQRANVRSFVGGKITGIFSMEADLRKLADEL